VLFVRNGGFILMNFALWRTFRLHVSLKELIAKRERTPSTTFLFQRGNAGGGYPMQTTFCVVTFFVDCSSAT